MVARLNAPAVESAFEVKRLDWHNDIKRKRYTTHLEQEGGRHDGVALLTENDWDNHSLRKIRADGP